MRQQRVGDAVDVRQLAHAQHVLAERLWRHVVHLAQVGPLAERDRVQRRVGAQRARLVQRLPLVDVRVAVGEEHDHVAHAGAVAARRRQQLASDDAQRLRGVRPPAGVVEVERVDDRLAAAVLVEVELGARLRRVGDGADAHAAEAEVEAVDDALREPDAHLVAGAHAAREVEHEDDVEFHRAACSRHGRIEERLQPTANTD